MLDLEEVASENERLEAAQAGGGNFLDFFVKMPEKEGFVLIRLLPPAKPGMFDRKKNPFFVRTRIHKIGKSVHCPKEFDRDSKKWQGVCPVCNYYNWLWSESKKATPEKAQQLQAQARLIKPIERFYYNALVRSQINDKTQQIERNVGPKFLSVGKTLHQMIVRAINGNPATDEAPLGDVTDIKIGRDFKIVKNLKRVSPTESYPNYAESKFMDPSPLGDPADVERWLSNLRDLVSLRGVLTNDQLKHELKVYLNIEKSNDDGFDPNEFQKSATAAEPTVTEETKKQTLDTSTASVSPTPPAVEEADESLADDDFLKQLKAMGN